MERVQEFSTVRFLTTALGAFFFYAAPQLSESTPFRLAGGSLTFAALSGVVLLFLLYRSVPYKRSLFVTAAVLGSTLAGFVRSIYGAWLPSLGQLAQSPLVLGYILLSGLVGLAVTYYYNDASNAKVRSLSLNFDFDPIAESLTDHSNFPLLTGQYHATRCSAIFWPGNGNG